MIDSSVKVPPKEFVERQVADHAISTWYMTGGYDRKTVQGFEVFWNYGDICKLFKAQTKEELVDKILRHITEEAKTSELFHLALWYGKGRLLLPRKNIVKLVLEKCPTWKQSCEDVDPRGAGMKIGRRIAKMNIPQEEETTK